MTIKKILFVCFFFFVIGSKAQSVKADSLLIHIVLVEVRNSWQDVPKALALCAKADKMAEQCGNKKLQAATYFDIAVANLELLKNYSQSLTYLIKALRISTEIKDSLSIQRCYQTIGNTYSDIYEVSKGEKDFKDAETNLLKAIEINKNRNDTIWLANNYTNMSDLYLKKRDADKSLFYATEAQKIYKKNSDPGGQTLARANICKALLLYAKKTGNKKDYLECKAIFNEYYYFAKLNMSKQKFETESESTRFWLIINLADYCTSMAEIEETLQNPKRFSNLIDSAEYFAGLSKNIKTLVNVLTIKAKHFEKLKPDYSLIIKNKIIKLQDSAYVMEARKKNETLEAVYKFNQTEIEYAQVQAENKVKSTELVSEKNQNAIKNKLLITSVISILIFCALLFYLFSLNKKLNAKNKLVSEQKEIIQAKNTQITDSINFSKIIQDEILFSKNNLNDFFKDHFLIYLPKDIVSGDFYFVKQQQNKLIIAVVDCTGHGISGAMMSLHANSLIQSVMETVSEADSAKYIDELNKKAKTIFKSGNSSEFSGKFGMDVSLLVINQTTKKGSYCSTGNPLLVKTKNELVEYKPKKATLTYFEEKYISYDVTVDSGNIYYLFTDGFYDQKGGPENKKFQYKNFKELISLNAGKNLKEQNDALVNTISEWKSNGRQTDDVTVLGFKV